MGKFYIDNSDVGVDEVAFVDKDLTEFSLKDSGNTLDVNVAGDYEYCFYKSDIDKMIALFQAAKDKLCN